MMLSVLVWLAMQGQVQAATPRMPNCWIDGNEVIHCHRLPKSIRYEDAPAEHVIEIRTVRDLDIHCVDWMGVGCWRVTRELWIDGVRWGVVKGLE